MSSPDSPSTTLSRSSRSSSSSSSSSLHIEMPATTASVAQNPTSRAWHHQHHHSHTYMAVPHIDTPHPLAAATQYLDKHVVGVFSKHHNEFNVNRQARLAKREARHSLVDSPIPEYEYEYEYENQRESDRRQQQQQHHRVSTALRTAAVTSFAPASVGGEGIVDRNEGGDNEAWMAVLARREAARLRSGTGPSGSSGGGDDLGTRHHHTDEQSASTSGNGN